MTLANINIQLDKNIAETYKATSKAKQDRLQQLLRFLIQEFADSTPESLGAIMDEMSHQAEVNGLSPEILHSLLEKDD